jgi:hypothetical protein
VRLHNTLNCRAYTKGEKYVRRKKNFVYRYRCANSPPEEFQISLPNISFCFPSFYVIISFKNCGGGGGGIQMGCVKNFGHVLHAQQHLFFSSSNAPFFESSRREKQINLKIQKMVTGHGGNNTRIFLKFEF